MTPRVGVEVRLLKKPGQQHEVANLLSRRASLLRELYADDEDFKKVWKRLFKQKQGEDLPQDEYIFKVDHLCVPRG